jgi:hypothetical protein
VCVHGPGVLRGDDSRFGAVGVLLCVSFRVIILCSVLYMTVGIFGYIYARGFTDGNILNNFRVSDPLAVIGRVALAFCIITGLPMIVLPSRQLLGKILILLFHRHTPSEIEVESTPTTPMSRSRNGKLSDVDRSILGHATDPHAEMLRALAATRSFQDCIDAHDPLEPAVDSDSEVEELTPDRNLSIDTHAVDAEYFTPTGHTPSTTSRDLSTPRTIENAQRSFSEVTSLIGGGIARTYSSNAVASASTGAAFPSHLATIHAEYAPPTESSEPQFSDRALVLQTIVICFSALVRTREVAGQQNRVSAIVTWHHAHFVPALSSHLFVSGVLDARQFRGDAVESRRLLRMHHTRVYHSVRVLLED